MKLRAVALSNVRRFGGQRATLDAIGDGITVLAEPNESGKSTLFDALHALFFERYRSTGKTVRSLQPHSGAAPEVAVEIETGEGRFRVEKRWLSRPCARVLDATGRIVAQEDEAEAFLDRLGAGGLAGPSALLWVRQGMTGLEPEAATGAERERLLASRRDLLSSVAGEIDRMTGGRRMDAVLSCATEALGALVTDTGRPKARGSWATALDEARALAARRDELAALAARLAEALAARRDAERARAELEDPVAEAERREAVAEAEARLRAAKAHAGDVAAAGQEVRLAECAATDAARDLTALGAAADRLAAAEAQLSSAAGAKALAVAAAEAARATEADRSRGAEEARAATAALRVRLDAARRAQMTARALREREDLAARLARAEAFRRQQEEAEARRALRSLAPEAVAAAEQAALALDRLRARAEAQAVALVFDYAGEGRARLDGQPIEGPLRLGRPAVIELPGLGRLALDPGERAGDDLLERLATAERAQAAALAACGAATLVEARQRLAEAQAAALAASRAAELLASVAPEGIEALRLALSRAEAEVAGAPEGPAEDPAAVAPLLAEAELAEAVALAAAKHATAAASAASEARIRAEADEAAALAARDAARIGAGPPEDRANRLAAAREAVAATAAALQAARSRHEALAAAAPDLATAEARLARARSVLERAAKEREALAVRAAELEGAIQAQADRGIEEELAEVEGRLAAVRARAGHCEAEAAALTRLKRALEEARSAARDAYFGPVTAELRPLLALLHEGADLRLDDRSLLPVTLTRAGVAEGLEILSGGTREQIAILTRLAFARLFARRGQPVPLILDDALVHSDDARIEAMFVALHRVARDQQILVLTCRARAFAALGGARARLRIEPLA